MKDMLRKRFRVIGILFLVYTLFALFSVSIFRAEYRLDRDTTPLRETLINEFTAMYTLLLVLPLQLWLINRLRIHRHNWYWAAPVHLLHSLLVGVIQTELMTVSRYWIYDLFHLRPYPAGPFFLRAFMEYHKQLIGYLTVMGVVYFLEHQRHLRRGERQVAEQRLEMARLKNDLQQAQLQALQGQIQPHFLFNTLNMISSVMYDDVSRADHLLSRLSEMLRKTLDGARRRTIPLEEEWDYTRSYLALMKARFEDRLLVNEEIDPETLSLHVPGFLLQPIVENAVKHNNADRRPLTITLRSRVRDSHLLLEVEDDGHGLAADEDGSKAEGIGLENVRERLLHHYGPEACLEIGNRESGGLRVTLRIPRTRVTPAADMVREAI